MLNLNILANTADLTKSAYPVHYDRRSPYNFIVCGSFYFTPCV